MLLGTAPKFQPETKGHMPLLMIKPLEWALRALSCRERCLAGGPALALPSGSWFLPRGGGATLLHQGKAKYCLIPAPGTRDGKQTSHCLSGSRSRPRPRLRPPEVRMKAQGGGSILVGGGCLCCLPLHRGAFSNRTCPHRGLQLRDMNGDEWAPAEENPYLATESNCGLFSRLV